MGKRLEAPPIAPNPNTGGNRRRASCTPAIRIDASLIQKSPADSARVGWPFQRKSEGFALWRNAMHETSAAAPACRCRSRAGRVGAVYLRAAQAYMLISMPTCTSTIFGVFQVIGGLHWIGVMLTPKFNVGSARKQRKVEQRRTVRVLQVRQPKFRSWARPLLSWASFCTIHESTEN